MNYLDLHADTLTKEEGVFHITEEALLAGGCALQCFAAFVDPRKGEGFSRASELADAYDKMCRSGQFCPFPEGMGEKICTLLTVEGRRSAENSKISGGSMPAACACSPSRGTCPMRSAFPIL